MTRKHIDEHQIVPRYLGGRLSPRERAEFEEYWAQNPSIIDELEATARLQDGISQLHRTGRFAAVLNAWTPRRIGWPLALAASLIVAVGAFAWIGLRGAANPILAGSPAPFMTNAVSPPSLLVDVQRARGTLYDASMTLPRAPALLELHVLPDTRSPAAQYTATLLSIAANGARTALGVANGVPVGEDGSVVVYADSTRLEPGRYELTLTDDPPTSGTGKPMSFLLKVNPPASN